MKVAIIGGGMTGLAAAYDLIQAGHQVDIFEASSHLGGLAAGFKEPGWSWTLEKFYHHWFSSDADMKRFQRDLNLTSKVIYSKPKSVVYYQEQFYQLDSLSAIFRFPGFNLYHALRFCLVTAYLKFFARWRSLESFTAAKWLKKYYGRYLFNLIWLPLLKGKFGPYHRKANMAWMWARLKSRTASLGTYEGGFQAFVDDVESNLKRLGVRIHLDTPIQKITSVQNGLTLSLGKNRSRTYDKVLVTLSPQLFSKLAPSLPESYLHHLKSLKSLGAVIVIFSLTKPLSPEKYYWYNLPKDAGFPFLALVEHTNFVPASHFSGDHLVYCGDYLPADHPYFTYPDDQLIATYLPGLKRINPDFQPSWVKKAWVFKAPYAQPVPAINHSRKIPSLTTPIPNLYYASMSHIYPWDRGTNYAVKLGRQVANLISSSS